MKILAAALLSGTFLISYPSLAQTTPQPASPAAPGVTGTSPAPAGAAAAPTPTRQITVSALTEKDLKGQNDADLGNIERVVESTTDKKSYIVVGRGGLWGFFGQEYLVPVDQLAVTGDQVVAKNMTQAQLESSAMKFVDDASAYRPLDGTQTVSIAEQR
jgi:hypothetical protein